MITPIIETKRIILRPLKVSDAEEAYNNWTTDPDVTKYMRWEPHKSINDTLEWLAIEESNLEKDNIYSWGFVHKEHNELFGSGGLLYNEEEKLFEIGYVIMKKYWNMGLTTEASKAIIDFGIKELQPTLLFAKHAKDNPASGKVMEKLGFVYQKDGAYSSFDGKRTYESRDYILVVNSTV